MEMKLPRLDPWRTLLFNINYTRDPQGFWKCCISINSASLNWKRQEKDEMLKNCWTSEFYREETGLWKAPQLQVCAILEEKWKRNLKIEHWAQSIMPSPCNLALTPSFLQFPSFGNGSVITFSLCLFHYHIFFTDKQVERNFALGLIILRVSLVPNFDI